MLDLGPIKKRVEAATEGPWWTGSGSEEDFYCGVEAVLCPYEVFQSRILFIVNRRFIHEADTEFIAAARTDIPALIAEVERLREEVAKLKTVISLKGG